MQRVDKLKQKNSSPGCDQTRTITKNCHEKEERDGGNLVKRFYLIIYNNYCSGCLGENQVKPWAKQLEDCKLFYFQPTNP